MQVVDNSSAFRMQEGVPLVIPEVNPEAVEGMKAGKGGIIANPNCSTIIALMAVTPLHRSAGVKRMVVSTYQVGCRSFQILLLENALHDWAVPGTSCSDLTRRYPLRSPVCEHRKICWLAFHFILSQLAQPCGGGVVEVIAMQIGFHYMKSVQFRP